MVKYVKILVQILNFKVSKKKQLSSKSFKKAHLKLQNSTSFSHPLHNLFLLFNHLLFCNRWACKYTTPKRSENFIFIVHKTTPEQFFRWAFLLERVCFTKTHITPSREFAFFSNVTYDKVEAAKKEWINSQGCNVEREKISRFSSEVKNSFRAFKGDTRSP